MLRKLAIVVLILAVIGAAVFWFVTIPATVPASALPAYAPNLENGKTMFYAGGCSSCHAIPNQEDKTKLGGGLGLKSPFGTFYAPNISPDRSDGIGDWSEANFVTAMLKGTSPDGSHYYPAFPYTSYQRMRMEDVRDLFAYLKTLPPVQGKVRGHDLPRRHLLAPNARREVHRREHAQLVGRCGRRFGGWRMTGHCLRIGEVAE